MKKLFTSVATVLTIGTVLTGCGSDTTEEASEDTASNLYETIQEEGVITIGTEGTYAPFTFHDEAGELTGFDVEIAEEVAERLGVEAEFVETQWDGIFAGLDAERFDMIANQVGVNEERLEKYAFSDPYIESGAVLVVSENNTDINSFEDVSGKTAAQSLTSNYGKMATEFGAEIEAVDGFSQSVQLIEDGRVDATFNDKLSYLDYKKQKPDAQIKVVDEEDEMAESALMFRQDGTDELVEAVNDALADMHEDGTYLEISEKWFGDDVSPK